MRPIKFRAWDGNENKLVHEGDAPVWNAKQKLTSGDLLNWFEDEDLMQFTGLLDKNGKEIYEGDVLRIFDKNYEVKFIQTGGKLFVDYGYPGEHNGPAPYWVEVIGNIYENSELLIS